MQRRTINNEGEWQAKKDMMFLYEILHDLDKYGYVPLGKADTMLNDWLGELKEKCGFSGTDKQLHRLVEKNVGKEILNS